VQSGVALHLFDREPERAREALGSIRQLSSSGLDEVRGVLGFLRGETDTAPVTPQPQLADLRRLAEQRSGLGLVVEFDDRTAGGPGIPSAIQTTAYRIAQEALTNVVRHSAAGAARVAVARDGDDLVVSIEDDGVGIPDGSTGAGSGIRGMSERAELVGGTLEMSPLRDGGTRVSARLPWQGVP
jgi:signal transduction histidine kinase